MLALAENSIQLVPDGTMFLHILIIVIMVAVLNRTLFKPLSRVLEEREATTQGRATEAQLTVMRARDLLSQYETRLREARTEGYHLLEQQKTQTLRERDQRITELKNEIGDWVGTQKDELRRQSVEARKSLESESQTLGQKIASQILGRQIEGGPQR